ncbi:MAG: HD domain-containing protein [Clostridiales bacterium]|jgi:predicted HD superfamily hydrolase involved in NAD metabolism|nr:HD domain-containing protein [Clostridiales bacterium]
MIMANAQKDLLIEYIERELSNRRKQHTYGVVSEAVALAKHYEANWRKAELAALCHDMVRDKPQEVLDNYVKEFNLDTSYIGNRNLSHAKIAAEIIKRDFGIVDTDIINSVSYHTTGRAGMSLLEKIIFIADVIEPGRSFPGVENLRNIAYRDLNEACIKALENTIDYITRHGSYLDRDSILAKYDLMAKERRLNEQ